MQGQTEGLPEVNPVVDGVFEYRYLTDTLYPLKHPVGEDIIHGEESLLLRSHQGGGSLIPAFCKEYVSASRKKLAVIHAARGATKIEEWLPGTARYATLVEKINKGVAKAKELEKVENVYFVWFQGCSDAIAQTTLQAYKNSFITLKNQLKKDADICEFGIIRVGYFASVVGWLKKGTKEERVVWDETIMQAQEEIVRKNEDCKILTRICAQLSLDLNYLNPQEEGHYSNKGLERIGAESAKKALEFWR